MKEFMKNSFNFLLFSTFLIEIIFTCKPYINYRTERLDFENFIIKYNITYRTQKQKSKAFDRFIGKKGAIYTRYCINTSQCPGGALPLTSDAGVSKFFDLTNEQFKKHFYCLELERKEINGNFVDFNSFLQKYFNKTNSDNSHNNHNFNVTSHHKKAKNLNNKNYLKKPTYGKEENSHKNITNTIYFDLRNNDLIKNSTLLDFRNSDEKSKKQESEIEFLINKEINSNITNENIRLNKSLEVPIEIYQKQFNFLKLIEYLNSRRYYIRLFDDEEVSKSFKKFYHLLKFKTNENLEFLIKNVGPVYVEINTSGLTFYEKGIFNPLSCEMKIDTNQYMGVLLVGYGKEGEFEYWIAKSFLGDNWGEEKGYFRILKRNDVDVFKPKMMFAIVLELNAFKE